MRVDHTVQLPSSPQVGVKGDSLGASGTVGGQGFGAGNEFAKSSAMCDKKSATHDIFVNKGLQQTGSFRSPFTSNLSLNI